MEEEKSEDRAYWTNFVGDRERKSESEMERERTSMERHVRAIMVRECFPVCLCCSWLFGTLALLQLLLFILAKGGGGTCKDTPTLKSDVSYGASALKRVIMILL
ncbi:hypothetical protein LR48_Vigan01g045500 [Vigna angularis]|uniref:Uncharacterized protein n=1 Tax=Phaseolus angularis TaxID=3914 RepID=A0A0L9TK13_PHAAN|nr:hypothetical protein LR48_Vigan01g045500 [Vigna angularis]